MTKVERLIALMYMLKRSHKGKRAKEIAEELGIAERTVFRDIQALNVAFQDYVQIITTDQGYKLDRTIFAPPLRIASEELEALSGVVNALGKTHPHYQISQQALSKIKSAYAEYQDLDLLNLEKQLQMMEPVHQDQVDVEILKKLEHAVFDKQVLKLRYFSFSSQEEKELVVHPYALVLRKWAWYLIAHSNTHDKIIHLKAIRIKQIEPLKSETFVTDPAFSVDTFFEDHWSVFEGQAKTIVLHFSAEMGQLIQEVKWHKSQTLTSIDAETLKLTLKTSINPELISWILGWGGDCQVISPPELKEEVTQKVATLAQKYL